MKNISTQLKVLVILSALYVGLHGIFYIIRGYMFYIKVSPMIKTAVPGTFYLVSVLWLGTYLLIGLIALICAPGFLLFKNWARRVFIAWASFQLIIMIWGRSIIIHHLAQAVIFYAERAKQLAISTGETIDHAAVDRRISFWHQMMDKNMDGIPLLLFETAIWSFLIYYFAWTKARESFRRPENN